jgi:drug/metabolite transporter (DMT)-like permease
MFVAQAQAEAPALPDLTRAGVAALPLPPSFGRWALPLPRLILASMMRRVPAPLIALVSALLFGASTPFAKLLLGEGFGPFLLAGLFYLGSGAGLAVLALLRRSTGSSPREAPLRRADLPWLALVVFFGGIAGPALLMLGLESTSGSTASLLLNVEGLATMAIAWVVFRESVDRRLLLGAAAILAGALVLSWQGEAGALGVGALAIVAACIAWGIDNNLTRKLSSADPIQIAMIKGLVAGAANTGLALAYGDSLPAVPAIALAGAVGFMGYGVSLVLFVVSLRHLGTARTGAYFSTAPFIGALVSVILLGDAVTVQLALAAALMASGVYLHLTERHDHEHAHEEMEHEHLHRHDEHHQHAHAADDPPGEPHSHRHRHAPLVHKHPHYPDLHHRHVH